MKRLAVLLTSLAMAGMLAATALAQDEQQETEPGARGRIRIQARTQDAETDSPRQLTEEEREQMRQAMQQAMEARREQVRLQRADRGGMNQQISALMALRRLDLSEDQQQQVSRILENAHQQIVHNVLTDEQRIQMELHQARPPRIRATDEDRPAPRRRMRREDGESERPDGERRWDPQRRRNRRQSRPEDSEE